MSRPEPEPAGFFVPRAAVRAELSSKGSRFVCELAPVANEDDVRRRLARWTSRYPGATHHCWVYRLGWPPRERSTDAGEPRGTAGQPMLKVLAGRGVSDTLAVVARWFGGTKLGRGGLARAYAGAVAAAVAAAELETRRPSVELAIEIPYRLTQPVRKLLRAAGSELVAAEYGELVRLELRIAVAERGELETALAELGVAPLAAP